jgi:hypothetical protein
MSPPQNPRADYVRECARKGAIPGGRNTNYTRRTWRTRRKMIFCKALGEEMAWRRVRRLRRVEEWFLGKVLVAMASMDDISN